MSRSAQAGNAPEWEALARRHVGGDLFDELVQAMLDVAAAPLDLGFANGPTLTALLGAATERLAAGLESEQPEVGDELRSSLPWHLEGVPLPSAVLQLATYRAYFALPDSIYEARPAVSRVLERIPDLADAIDDDGLVHVDGLDAGDQGLFAGPWAVHYHQLLRRGFSSNINDPLLRKLLEVASERDCHVRIGIDHRRICARLEFVNYIEEDYWYGPPLTEQWLDDPYKWGRTVHEDPKGNAAPQGYKAFFVYWRMNGETKKVVQMEELPTPELAIDGRYLCRYLHAIRDIERGEFVHCDGAVRMYESETFDDRVVDGMPSATRADRYRKVWRIDGSISTAQWSDIVAKWFRGNQLPGEYLERLNQEPPR